MHGSVQATTRTRKYVQFLVIRMEVGMYGEGRGREKRDRVSQREREREREREEYSVQQVVCELAKRR